MSVAAKLSHPADLVSATVENIGCYIRECPKTQERDEFLKYMHDLAYEYYKNHVTYT